MRSQASRDRRAISSKFEANLSHLSVTWSFVLGLLSRE